MLREPPSGLFLVDVDREDQLGEVCVCGLINNEESSHTSVQKLIGFIVFFKRFGSLFSSPRDKRDQKFLQCFTSSL